MSILLRRCTTQFLDLEGVLEEDDPEPEAEEVEELEGMWERARGKEINVYCQGKLTCLSPK